MTSLGITEQAYSPDKLIVSEKVITEETVVLSGEGVLTRSTLLGQVTREVGTIVAGVGNTGDGTAAATMGHDAEIGNYLVTMSGATAFAITSPQGFALPSTNTHITVVITAGSTPLISGDTFTVPVEVPAAVKFRKALLASVDGSEIPDRILGADIDAISADVTTWSYIAAEVDKDEVTFGTGLTVANTKDALRAKNIILKTVAKGN